MANRYRAMGLSDIKRSRAGLNALVGSPFRIKQIQDGLEGLRCKFCSSVSSPLISGNENVNCGACEALLYDGPNRAVK